MVSDNAGKILILNVFLLLKQAKRSSLTYLCENVSQLQNVSIVFWDYYPIHVTWVFSRHGISSGPGVLALVSFAYEVDKVPSEISSSFSHSFRIF